MNGWIAGAVAVVVGGGLAFATVAGIVNVVNDNPEQSDASVMDYGSNGE